MQDNSKQRLGLSVAIVLALGIVALGAFVRLSDAGLGCPDWPTCYGHVLWPSSAEETAAANQVFDKTPVETDKTWPEQVHRLFASSLGLILLLLFVAAFRQEQHKPSKHFALSVVIASQCLLIARIGLASLWVIDDQPVYDQYDPVIALMALLLLGLVIARLMLDQAKPVYWAALAVVMVTLQGLFGMWTVTLKLWPQVVTLHLLGAMALIAILLANRASLSPKARVIEYSTMKLSLLAVSSVLMVFMQIALGGWLSSNYAAVACADFPTCQGSLWPPMDFKQGFNVFQQIGPNYLGGQLLSEARAAIHVIHRLGAVLTAVVCLWYLILLWRVANVALKKAIGVAAMLLVTQIGLGVGNVVLGFPMVVAVLHTLVAALLWSAMIVISLPVFALRKEAARRQFA